MKDLVQKSDIDSLNSFIEKESGLKKDLTLKIYISDENVNASEAFH